MGTRGAIGFVSGGDLKAAYNHYDSYPEGLGQGVVDFLNGLIRKGKLDEFIAKAKKVTLVNEDVKPTPAQIEKYKKYSDTGVSSGELQEWYVLLRKCQGEGLLEAINEGLDVMPDATEFLKDSLFCEYAYVINLDKKQLDLFVGFQREKQETPNPLYKAFGDKPDGEYYPVRYLGSVSLEQEIPEDWAKPFEIYDEEKEKEEA